MVLKRDEMILKRASAYLAVAAVVLLGPLAAGASAHAAYKSSDPPDEGTVSSPPSRVTAEFTEPPTDDSRMEIHDACGRRVDNGDTRTVGYEVTVTMSGSARGTYTVSWAVISRVDGHPTRGTFSFTSTGGEACPGEKQPQGSSSGGGSNEPEPQQKPQQQSADDSSAEETESRPQASGRGRGRAGDGRGGGGRGAGEGEQRGGSEPTEPLTQLAQERPAREIRSEPAVWDLPMGDFAIALAVSALIGAAGGFVYAGIMGPRRPAEKE